MTRIAALIMLCAFAVLDAASGAAWAQFADPNQQTQCMKFIPLRDDVQKRGTAIGEAFKRHAPANEACDMLKNFQAAETKMVKFVEDNTALCGFPPDALKQLKGNQAKTAQAKTNACNAAAAPKGPPAPTLSDALGTTRVPDASNTRTGRGGTFDTLSGNPISK